MDIILSTLIQQLNSSVFVLIAILVVVGWLLYKSGGWVQIIKDFTENKDKIDAKIGDIQSNISEIKATTGLLYQAHLSTVKAHSPLSLTVKGKRIAKDLKLRQKIKTHWRDLKKKIRDLTPSNNPYDIQGVCMGMPIECFEKYLTDKEQNEVKTYAYGHGINLLEIYPILGILMRDKYFKEEEIILE